MTERKSRPVPLESPTVRKEADPSQVSIFFVNMKGETDGSPHEPLGLRLIQSRVEHDIPGIRTGFYDTQPELVMYGKIDTDNIVNRQMDFFSETKSDGVLAMGMPIFSFNYGLSTIMKTKEAYNKLFPERKLTTVIGGSIPTYTNPELLKRYLPDTKIIAGEGEEAFSDMIKKLSRGEEVTDSLISTLPDIATSYVLPRAESTRQIIDLGGVATLEGSRGCDHGACTFCSRCHRGKDYRVVSAENIRGREDQIRAIDVHRAQLLDEDAFGDVTDTKKEGQTFPSVENFIAGTKDKPRVSVGVSVRVETINALSKHGLLPKLREAGLDKIFMGVEGGSNEFFKLIAKGHKVHEVKEALQNVKKSVWTDENGKKHPLEMEMGFITFSWRMNMQMLRENIDFISDPDITPHVSSLFNNLEVRAGTIDETILREHIYGRKLPNGKIIKRETPAPLVGYDPDKQFSINDSKYKDVPFLDPEVGKVYKKVHEFAKADEELYYDIKSINRAASLPEKQQEKAKEFYLGMKDIHIQFLRDAVGLEEFPNLPEKRRQLVTKMIEEFGSEPKGDKLDGIRRKAKAFILEEHEREVSNTHQVGAVAVIKDAQGRHLLVRPRGQDEWSYPGGNIHSGESAKQALRRELYEELRLKNVRINRQRERIVKENHIDATTGFRPTLTLHHFDVSAKGTIDMMHADHEIVDSIYLEPEVIFGGPLPVKENVQQVVLRDIAGKDETVVFQGN